MEMDNRTALRVKTVNDVTENKDGKEGAEVTCEDALNEVKEKNEQVEDENQEEKEVTDSKDAMEVDDRGNESEQCDDKVADSADSEEPKTPVAPAMKPKSVERLVAMFEQDAAKEFHVEKGRGTALKDIPTARKAFVNDFEDLYPDAISDYRLYDYRGDLVPLSSIPVQWNWDERLASYDREITLNGFVQISHHGRRQSWHQIKAWKFDMSTKDSEVEISVLSEEWIKLKYPSHDYVKFHKSLLVALHTLRFFKSNPQAKWQTFVAHISTIFSSEDIMSCLFEHGLFFREATLRDGALAKSQVWASFLESLSLYEESRQLQPEEEKQQQPLQHVQPAPAHDISNRFVDVLSKIKGAFQKQDYQSFDMMMLLLLRALVGKNRANKTTMSSVEGDQDNNNKHAKPHEETPNKLVLVLDDMLKEMRKGAPQCGC